MKNLKVSDSDTIATTDSIRKMKEQLFKKVLRMAKVSKVITEREGRILWLRFGFQKGAFWTYKDIGKEERISSERVRKLINNALEKIESVFWENHLLKEQIIKAENEINHLVGLIKNEKHKS